MLARPRVTALLLLHAVSLACAGGNESWVRAQPIDAYRAYGEYHDARIDAALVEKSKSMRGDLAAIRIFQEQLPAGIAMGPQTLYVEKGAKHVLIGKYAYSPGKEVSKDELVARVKALCAVAGANAAIVLFAVVPNERQKNAQAIEAVLVKLADDQGGQPSQGE